LSKNAGPGYRAAIDRLDTAVEPRCARVDWQLLADEFRSEVPGSARQLVLLWIASCARHFTGALAEHPWRPPPPRTKKVWTQFAHDIYGNPFRPAVLDSRWSSADAVALARAIYDDRAFDRLPILADSLIEAGCDDEQILDHCRGSGPHDRGCWVVDLVLGKE
jgi:hypothetical protein